MNRSLTKREKRILAVCLMTIFIYVSYHGIIRPIQVKAEALDRKIQAAQVRLNKDLRVIRKANALSQEYEAFRRTFAQSKSNEQVMTSMLSEIEVVASQLGLRISDLKPKRVRVQEGYNHFSVSLTLDSAFVDIVHFLYILQDHPHLFGVEDLEFNKGTRQASETIKTQLVLSKILIP